MGIYVGKAPKIKKPSAPISTYKRQSNWERIEMPESMNMKILRKAVYLSNTIFQKENEPYIEKLLYNSQDEFVYFYPKQNGLTIKDISIPYYKACLIVYEAVITKKNITASEMKELNVIFNILKK